MVKNKKNLYKKFDKIKPNQKITFKEEKQILSFDDLRIYESGLEYRKKFKKDFLKFEFFESNVSWTRINKWTDNLISKRKIDNSDFFKTTIISVVPNYIIFSKNNVEQIESWLKRNYNFNDKSYWEVATTSSTAIDFFYEISEDEFLVGDVKAIQKKYFGF